MNELSGGQMFFIVFLMVIILYALHNIIVALVEMRLVESGHEQQTLTTKGYDDNGNIVETERLVWRLTKVNNVVCSKP